MIRRVLVANRGEIACRVIRSCRRLGIEAVAVYSTADAGMAHVAAADASIEIGPAAARDSYLRPDRIIAAARESGADAVHPGYGFLSENPEFGRAVRDAGLTWIGPDPQVMENMGDKARARTIADAAGLPVLPGSPRFPQGVLDGLEEAAAHMGLPLLVKAAAGGGGMGMGRVDAIDRLREVVETSQTMAAKSFKNGTVYLERFISRARHVEIQVFGFGSGRAIHVFERECSIQRRFQKIIEESPAPNLPTAMLTRTAEAAAALARHQNYESAGTIEFIVDDESGEFFFLEMNTRIQVEHTVTETITGLDLVAMQIELARGTLEPLDQSAITASGHAIECRLYAEDPARSFRPSPGKLVLFDLPKESYGIRVDTGLRAGDSVSIHYDPMIAKIIAWGESRNRAIARMTEALATTRIEGVQSNRDLLLRTLAQPEFQEGRIHTQFIQEHWSKLVLDETGRSALASAHEAS